MTPIETDHVMSLRMCTTLISFIFTTVALIFMRRFKLNTGHFYLQRLIFISTWFECVISLISFITYHREVKYASLCYAQGLMLQFAHVAFFCWTTVFTFNLYLVIVHHRLDPEKYTTWYHGLSWSIASICTLVPNMTFAFGRTTVWCWISKEAPYGNLFRFATFFIPFYIACAIIIFTCASIIVRIYYRYQLNTDPMERQRDIHLLRRFYVYPILFLVCYIPATVNRINNWVTGNDVYVLFILHVLTAPTLGTLNAIIFFLNTDVKAKLVMWWWGIVRHHDHDQDQPSSSTSHELSLKMTSNESMVIHKDEQSDDEILDHVVL